ncbi:MAG: hydroxymethylbilane synthase [Anaerolineae bacterium]|nr:hydroxymethylbilane synthase [Anaerolineae bacterium]
MPDSRTIRIGTRGSALARWQTEHVAALLRAAHPALEIAVEILTTQGDRMLDQPLAQLGGKGAFTAELEAALRGGAIDFAVHSLKDLPTDLPDGLIIGAIPERANPSDVLVSRDSFTLATLPRGATIGSGSIRRAAQLLHLLPHLNIVDIRGNVDTRIRKAHDPESEFDAIVLAYAGLERLGRLDVISQRLSLDEMMPAPGQGALAVQCRDEAAARALLAPIQHAPSAAAVTAERAFLTGLRSGCTLPVAAYAEVVGDRVLLRGRVNSADGAQQIDVSLSSGVDDAEPLGYRLADEALARGAAALLESPG